MFRPFVLSVGQDLHILLLAAVHSRVILPSSDSNRIQESLHGNHKIFMPQSEILRKKTNIGEEKTLVRAA